MTTGHIGFLGRQERRALKAQVLGISPVKVSERELDEKLRADGRASEYTAAYLAATGATRVGRHDRAVFGADTAPAAERPAAQTPARRRRGRKAPSVPAQGLADTVEHPDTAATPAGGSALTQDDLDLDLSPTTQPAEGTTQNGMAV